MKFNYTIINSYAANEINESNECTKLTSLYQTHLGLFTSVHSPQFSGPFCSEFVVTL